MCTFGVLGLSCASPGGPVWWSRREVTGFTLLVAGFNRPSLGGGALLWLSQLCARSVLRCWTAAQCLVSGSSLQCMMWCVMPVCLSEGAFRVDLSVIPIL